MTNYFASIVSRAITPAPAVRPRLRGKFDPPDTAIQTGLELLDQRETPMVNDRPSHHENRPAQTGQASRAVSSAAEGSIESSNRNEIRDEPRQFERRSPAAEAQPPASQFDPGLKRPAIEAPPRPSKHPLFEDSQSGTAASRSNPEGLSAMNRFSETHAPQPPANETPTTKPVPFDSGSDRRSGPWSGEVASRPVPETRVILKTVEQKLIEPVGPGQPREPKTDDRAPQVKVSMPAIPVQPRIEPLRETRVPVPHFAASKRDEPTVHVTIGRIEVRAVTPQAQPASRTRAAQPAMNLDDYLRQRSRGNAR